MTALPVASDHRSGRRLAVPKNTEAAPDHSASGESSIAAADTNVRAVGEDCNRDAGVKSAIRPLLCAVFTPYALSHKSSTECLGIDRSRHQHRVAIAQ